MSLFTLSEQKSRVFHQAILGLIGGHPNLIPRAIKELAGFRSRRPGRQAVWDRWAAILDLPPQQMAGAVLADTADGGLLRANSPLADALSHAERNAIWRRIGLMQFMGHYFDAAADLALDLPEQAAITGVPIEALTGWRTNGPWEITEDTLSRLKQVVSLHKALTGINPDPDVRRRWLRHQSPTLSATPLSLLMDGKGDRVLETLAGAVQLILSPDDLPRMGNA